MSANFVYALQISLTALMIIVTGFCLLYGAMMLMLQAIGVSG